MGICQNYSIQVQVFEAILNIVVFEFWVSNLYIIKFVQFLQSFSVTLHFKKLQMQIIKMHNFTKIPSVTIW